MEGENICAQGFFSFAQGDKHFVKNEGEIVRVRNTLHLGSEPLLLFVILTLKGELVERITSGENRVSLASSLRFIANFSNSI